MGNFVQGPRRDPRVTEARGVFAHIVTDLRVQRLPEPDMWWKLRTAVDALIAERAGLPAHGMHAYIGDARRLHGHTMDAHVGPPAEKRSRWS